MMVDLLEILMILSFLVRMISKQANVVSGSEVERELPDMRFVRLIPPIERDLKANVDVSYDRLCLRTATAVVVRDSAGDVVFCETERHDHIVNPLHGKSLPCSLA